MGTIVTLIIFVVVIFTFIMLIIGRIEVEREEYVKQIQDKIKILPAIGKREVLSTKHISHKGNSKLKVMYKLFKEAEDFGAHAITDLSFNSQMITSVSSESGTNLMFPFLSDGKVKKVSSSREERCTIAALAITYKYSDEEEKLIYTEKDAIEDFKKIEILKNNDIIDTNDYLSRKNEIKQKVQNYKDFLLQKEAN